MKTEEQVVSLLKEKKASAATAESLTGGSLAGAIVNVSGASAVFRGGIVSYSNEMKHRLLGVRRRTLRIHGAISRETACGMAKGAVRRTGADFGIATTGNAGPSGDEGKPVGLVYIACFDRKGRRYVTKKLELSGNRQEIRQKTVKMALILLKDTIGLT